MLTWSHALLCVVAIGGLTLHLGGCKPENAAPTALRPLRCSFCGKTQREVKKLIAGPNVYICDECVDLCYDIIHSDATSSTSTARGNPTQAPERR